MGPLLSHPEQRSQLLQNGLLTKPAIEEAARYETPVQFFGRGVSEDITLRSKHLSEGQPVFAALGAANRGPPVNPDVVRSISFLDRESMMDKNHCRRLRGVTP